VFLTFLVLVSAIGAVSPLVDAETLARPAYATLAFSAKYLVFAPACDLYDILTLLSLRQHFAMIGVSFLIYVLWRGVRRRRRGCTTCTRELRAVAVKFAALLAVYALGLLVSRPMAQLVLHDRDLVAIDFHSHTNASWDGRHSFTAEENRKWHRSAGFDVAYISDHKSVAGAREAARHNPVHAGDEMVLLQALEARDADEHVLALNIDTTSDIDPKGQWHDPHLTHELANELRAPMLILSVPGNVRKLPFLQKERNAPIYAVELSDGSPKGIDQVQKAKRDILHLADSLNLAVVAGSDNHGWGRTAIAWSVLRIPGWQRMTVVEIDSAIQRTIRTYGRHAGVVIARRTPDPGTSPLLLAASPFTIGWNLLHTLSWAERVSWIVWGWVVWGAAAYALRRRQKFGLDRGAASV